MNNSQTKKSKRLIKYGDLFKLGEHFLLCGNTKDSVLINEFLKDQKIKTILSDVPYGINYVESKNGFNQKIAKPKEIIGDQYQSDADYSLFTQKWLEIVKPYLKRKNSVYIFNSDKMIFALREGMLSAGYKFSQLLIWIKNHSVIGRKDYLLQHELIAYGWFGCHDFRKSKDKSILFYPKPNKNTLHPTMKPVGLLRRLILNSTDTNETIYDPFAGSGSLMVACEQTKRKCLMVEIDSEYCQTIIERFEKISKEKVEKVTILNAKNNHL